MSSRPDWEARSSVRLGVLVALLFTVWRALLSRRANDREYAIDSKTRSEVRAVQPPRGTLTPLARRTKWEGLTAIATLVTGVAAVMALGFSSVTLNMQRSQQAINEARVDAVYAEHLTFWWEYSHEENAMVLHVLNANQAPIAAWIYLTEDEVDYLGPGKPLPLASGAGFVAGPIGGVIQKIYFLGQVAPCSQIDVVNPLGDYDVGSLLFTDPSGDVWTKTFLGRLDKLSLYEPNQEGLSDRLELELLNVPQGEDLGISEVQLTRRPAPVCGNAS